MITQQEEDREGGRAEMGDDRGEGGDSGEVIQAANENDDKTEARLMNTVKASLLRLVPEVFRRGKTPELDIKDNKSRFLSESLVLEQAYESTIKSGGNKYNKLTICKLRLDNLGSFGISGFIGNCLRNQESIVLIPHLDNETVELLTSSGTSRTYSFKTLENPSDQLFLIFFENLTTNGGKVFVKLAQDFQGYLSEDYLVAISEKSRTEAAQKPKKNTPRVSNIQLSP